MVPDPFYRASCGFIVHVKFVAQMHTHFNGKLLVELVPSAEKEVIINREKASRFEEWLEG